MLLLIACTTRSPVPDTGDPTTVVVEEDPPVVLSPEYLDLFDHEVLHEIRLGLPPESIAALGVAPREWVVGTFEHDGEVLEDVGVRLKGSSTFREIDDKAAFKVSFRKFVDGREYAELERLTLNNLTNDASQGREVIAYEVWNRAGIAAPRAAFAKVWVNEEYYGLYAMLEPMDDAYLRKRYTDPDGDLWEANDSADLTAAGVAHFELASGEGAGLPLGEVADGLLDEDGDYYAAADRFVDMEQFLDFYAWTMATGNYDGYPYHLNDFYLYGDPSKGGRFQFSPWGMDETWDTGWSFQWGRGVVAFDCSADHACMERILERTEQALLSYEALDVPMIGAAMFALTEEAMQTDPRMPWSPAEVDRSRTALLGVLATWPDTVRRSIEED